MHSFLAFLNPGRNLFQRVLATLVGIAFGVLPVLGPVGVPRGYCRERPIEISGLEGILEVDPESGAASMFLPLGPGIGNSGLCYIPALVGRFAPQVGVDPDRGLALLATTGFELSPGTMDLLLDRGKGYEGTDLPDVRWTYPDGTGGCTGHSNPSEDKAVDYPTRYGYGPSVGLGKFPHRQPVGSVPFMLLGTAGEVLVALTDETWFPERQIPCIDERGTSDLWIVPSCILADRCPEQQQSRIPYGYGKDIPTFQMDAFSLTLMPVPGVLTRWSNWEDEIGIHQRPDYPRLGLMGGAAPTGGRVSGSESGPSGGGKSMAGIRAYDHGHSQPGGPSGGGKSMAAIRAFDRSLSQPGTTRHDMTKEEARAKIKQAILQSATDMVDRCSFTPGAVVALGPMGQAAKTVANIVHAGIHHEGKILDCGIKWLGPGYKEVAPGVYRSADGLRQYRMAKGDLQGRGKIPNHVHFEAFDTPASTKPIENLHVLIEKD